MASYGWTVREVDELPFVTAMALMDQVRRYPPQSVLQVDMMEAVEAEQKREREKAQEDAMRNMGVVEKPKTQRKVLGVWVKKTGQKIA